MPLLSTFGSASARSFGFSRKTSTGYGVLAQNYSSVTNISAGSSFTSLNTTINDNGVASGYGINAVGSTSPFKFDQGYMGIVAAGETIATHNAISFNNGQSFSSWGTGSAIPYNNEYTSPQTQLAISTVSKTAIKIFTTSGKTDSNLIVIRNSNTSTSYNWTSGIRPWAGIIYWPLQGRFYAYEINSGRIRSMSDSGTVLGDVTLPGPSGFVGSSHMCIDPITGGLYTYAYQDAYQDRLTLHTSDSSLSSGTFIGYESETGIRSSIRSRPVYNPSDGYWYRNFSGSILQRSSGSTPLGFSTIVNLYSRMSQNGYFPIGKQPFLFRDPNSGYWVMGCVGSTNYKGITYYKGTSVYISSLSNDSSAWSLGGSTRLTYNTNSIT